MTKEVLYIKFHQNLSEELKDIHTSTFRVKMNYHNVNETYT
jgi:hypothetical protein